MPVHLMECLKPVNISLKNKHCFIFLISALEFGNPVRYTGSMKTKIILKNQAIALRKNGLSYNEIRKKVDVSKSTLSVWLKSIHLKPEYKNRLYTKQIRMLSYGAQSQKERRKREIDNILKKADEEIKLPLAESAYRLFGAALYWAEGNKQKIFEITNSDPYLILFMVRWFSNIFGASPQFLRARLNIYPQQNEAKIKKFWSDITDIPIKNFGKSYIKPLSTGYKKNNLYYGTIKIYVPKGTDFRHQVFGWIQAVLKDIKPKIEFNQNKWQTLKETSRSVAVNL